MRTRIAKDHDGGTIHIDQPLLDSLNIGEDCEVELEVTQGGLIVKPIRERAPNPVAEAFDRVLQNPEGLHPLTPASKPAAA